MEVASILENSRTEEGSTELSIRKGPLGNRLGDGGLPSSGQPVQPVDGGLVEIPCPELDFIQDGSAGSLQTRFAITMPIFCRLRTAEIIKDGCISY